MKNLFGVLVFLLLGLPGIAQAGAGTGDGIVEKISQHDVVTTMDRLEFKVKEKGLAVFARVDHQANAEDVGMEMGPAQVLIFGNPKAGTLIMQFAPVAGLDLPLRVLVYRDEADTVRIAYHDPHALQVRLGADDLKVFDKVSGVLDTLTTYAAH